ncbi:hypothetical protein [Paenibacillus radicis (ex Xue et al. 2023)]|uniref:Uncharacterized protein n=1 Tax=Paenibacillus radicis (ex Xue et al. 2023) TaxID=2972489 RepID=A0ABT1YJV6_9BACL|nr:hypothetical protein [Paenibacillus radicis (ex Xue et al. 2023)]MCR8633482.1 hypothetical protein [Paenibacillus radicis (ex Xue et al. 2023)]
MINTYLDKLEGTGKRHVLLIVTPRDEYPINFLDEKYYMLEQAILENPKSYIGIYDQDEKEIMQYTAFRLFLRPVICDKYSLVYKETTKVKRLNEKEIISYFVTKHFYDTVPFGEKSEEEAIKEGKIQAKEFLENHTLDEYEFASVKLGKDSNEANTLIKLNFKNENENYYFDYVYVR